MLIIFRICVLDNPEDGLERLFEDYFEDHFNLNAINVAEAF